MSTDYEARIAKALDWPRLSNDIIASIEFKVIELTGDGELAAYVARWFLDGPGELALKIERALRAAGLRAATSTYSKDHDPTEWAQQTGLRAGIEALEND